MEIARHWRLNPQRYQLVGSQCDRCKKPSFPPKAECEECIIRSSNGNVYFTPIAEKEISQPISEDSRDL